jgi:hypothetical protein
MRNEGVGRRRDRQGHLLRERGGRAGQDTLSCDTDQTDLGIGGALQTPSWRQARPPHRDIEKAMTLIKKPSPAYL